MESFLIKLSFNEGGKLMLKFIMQRILYGAITLLIIITFTFFLIHAAPGDPVAAKCKQMPESAREIVMKKYGLDKPVPVRYVKYMKNLIFHGELGDSVIYPGKTVNDVIKKNAPVSGKIGGLALITQVVVGILLGIISALNRNKLSDQVIRVLSVLAICIPYFVFAALLQYFIGYKWDLTPVFGWGEPVHYILPVLTMSFAGIATYCKYMRSSTVEVINEDYILTAISKGIPRLKLVWKHIIRNAIIPIITLIGPAIAFIFAGTFITESMFGIPGLGKFYVKSIQDNDYNMILGQTIFMAALYIISLIIVDILYGLADPRIRIKDKK